MQKISVNEYILMHKDIPVCLMNISDGMERNSTRAGIDYRKRFS